MIKLASIFIILFVGMFFLLLNIPIGRITGDYGFQGNAFVGFVRIFMPLSSVILALYVYLTY